MNRLSLATWFFVLLSVTALAEPPSEQPKQIPLDQIWGYNLPGTRDITGLPLPEDIEQLRLGRERNIEEVRRALTAKRPADHALSSFILPRSPDLHVLRIAGGQLESDSRLGAQSRARISNSYSTSNELTLVFFSHPTSNPVRLKNVERQGSKFTVNYQFEPPSTPEVNVHFALIPLGQLSAGEYQVEFEQTPNVQDSSKIVCQAFSFKVVEPPAAETKRFLIRPDTIYVYDMPQFGDVREFESPRTIHPGWQIKDTPLVYDIGRSLHRPFQENHSAGAAFVVEGYRKTALTNAHAVLTNKAERMTEVPSDTDLTLVFYSLTFGRYVWLDSVEQSKTEVVVDYRFVSHMTAEATNHFALIPLGTLSPGPVEVKIRQLPPKAVSGTHHGPVENAERIVSGSFTFEVVE